MANMQNLILSIIATESWKTKSHNYSHKSWKKFSQISTFLDNTISSDLDWKQWKLSCLGPCHLSGRPTYKNKIIKGASIIRSKSLKKALFEKTCHIDFILDIESPNACSLGTGTEFSWLVTATLRVAPTLNRTGPKPHYLIQMSMQTWAGIYLD